MGSNTHHQSFEQPNLGLLRFRSAPSSLFSGFESSEFESPAVGNYCSLINCSSSSPSVSSSIGFLDSNLVRQISTPAEVFSQFIQNGYGGESFNKVSANNNGGEEVGNVKLANSNGEAQFFTSSSFPFTSWNQSSHFSEPFPCVKLEPDSNRKLFSSSNQNGENGNRVCSLSHHLSLPKNVSDITSVEKLLQLQDSVPCRIRAKRGCATHPRSIAERVRRTRISERMRKLQELVPNMDKQMNTSDMLDLAVDYIKELKKQFKMLSDNRAKCVCLN